MISGSASIPDPPAGLIPLPSDAAAIGTGIIPKTLAEAVKADVIFLAVRFESHPDVAKVLSDWEGKIIVDVTNAYGVPPEQTVQLVEGVIQAGGTPDDVLDLPSEVEAGMAHGRSAAQAAQGLGRGHATGTPGGRPLVPPGQAKKHKP